MHPSSSPWCNESPGVELYPPPDVPLNAAHPRYSTWYWTHGPGSAPTHQKQEDFYAGAQTSTIRYISTIAKIRSNESFRHASVLHAAAAAASSSMRPIVSSTQPAFVSRENAELRDITCGSSISSAAASSSHSSAAHSSSGIRHLLPVDKLVNAVASLLPADGRLVLLSLVGSMVIRYYGHQFANKNADSNLQRNSHGPIKTFIENHPHDFEIVFGTDVAKSPFVRRVGAERALDKPSSQKVSTPYTCIAEEPMSSSVEPGAGLAPVHDTPVPIEAVSASIAPSTPLQPRIVRLQVHVPGVEHALQVHADSVEELRTELQEQLASKQPEVALPRPLDFSILPPVGDDEVAYMERPTLIDEQLWSLPKNTRVWVLPPPQPFRVHVVLPTQNVSFLCSALSLSELEQELAQQLAGKGLALSEGVFFSATVPTTSAPQPLAVNSWADVQSLPAPVTLYAVWRWCFVPLRLQKLINTQLDVENGVCAICTRPLKHHAHFAPS